MQKLRVEAAIDHEGDEGTTGCLPKELAISDTEPRTMVVRPLGQFRLDIKMLKL